MKYMAIVVLTTLVLSVSMCSKVTEISDRLDTVVLTVTTELDKYIECLNAKLLEYNTSTPLEKLAILRELAIFAPILQDATSLMNELQLACDKNNQDFDGCKAQVLLVKEFITTTYPQLQEYCT